MKLSGKISLSFFITAVILTSIAVSIVLITVRKSLKEGIYEHLRSVSQSRAGHIETFMNEDKSRIELMAESDPLESAVEKIVHGPRDVSTYAAEANALLSNLLELEKEAYELFIISPEGAIISSSNKLNLGKDRSGDDYFLKGLKNSYITDAAYTETGEKGYYVSAPITHDKTEEILGMLVAGFRMTGLNNITGNRTGLGNTGEVFIVNKDGYMITPSRSENDTFMQEKEDTFCILHRVSPVEYSEHTEIKIYSGYKNIMVLGTHAYIPGLQWCVLAQIDMEEAMAPLSTIKHVLLGILIFIPLAAWVMGMYASGIVTRPLRKLQRGTEIIGRGDLDHKVGVISGDEIGQLSRAFDRMTQDLKNTMTSVDALNKEVSERKTAEALLRESEEKYKRIVEMARAVILVISKDYRILEFNQEAERIYGCKREEALGKNYIEQFLPEDVRAAVMDDIKKVLEGEPTIGYENPVIGLNGVRSVLLWNVTRILDAKEGPAGFLAVGYDISDRKGAEDVLKKAKEEAETANLAKSQFLSNISHELRTPLNSILGFADLMKDTALNDTQKDYVQTIYSSGKILLNLINDILDLSKIEAGEIEIEHIPFDLAQLSESVMRIVRPRLDKRGIKMIFNMAEGMPVHFQGDPTRVRQILLNLLSNAVRFTNEGEITLSLAEDTSAEPMKKDMAKIKIVVKDTGIGIARDKQNTIFDAFVQEDSSTTRQYGGTGLGLTIVKRLAAEMDGEVHVRSEKGKGSEFTVTIFLTKQTDIREIDISRVTKPDTSILKGLNVLLVEDDEMNLKLIIRMLDKFGCITDTAYDGKEAIEKIRDKTYDLVLMDIQLPVMSGIRVTEIVRGEMGSDVPIVALTAAAMKGDKERAMASGMNDYLIKPVDSEEIEEILLRLILREKH